MSQKKAKERRKAIRNYYEYAMKVWEINEPPRWRFIAHRKWKKRQPKCPHICRDMGRNK